MDSPHDQSQSRFIQRTEHQRLGLPIYYFKYTSTPAAFLAPKFRHCLAVFMPCRAGGGKGIKCMPPVLYIDDISGITSMSSSLENFIINHLLKELDD